MALTRLRPWIAYVMGACAVGLGVLAALQYAVWREDLVAARLGFIEGELSKLRKEVDEIAKVGEVKAVYDAYVRTADTARERKTIPAAEALAELSRLPQKVILQRVSIEMNRLTAIGDAASESDLAAVLPALRGARFIAKASITESPSSAARRGFQLSAEISRPGSSQPLDAGTRQ